MNFFKKFQTKYPKNPISATTEPLPIGDEVRMHYRFTGLVQGVGFRVEMWRRAMNMKLTGWVKNNFDGSVDAELQGPRQRIEKLIQQMHEIPRIHIETMDCQEIPLQEESEFELLNY
ncbi:hypothetical protein C815_01067 [Firmicutes bacterium M10-2]|nr:hypothetical protein C815_01067 [Firmicutes bacterium M10-2]